MAITDLISSLRNAINRRSNRGSYNLPDILEGLLANTTDGPVINIRRLGVNTGSDIANRLNSEIQNAAPGTRFLIPSVGGANTATRWLIDQPIVLKSGVSLIGQGFRSGAGSVLRRTGAFNALQINGTGGGQASTDMISKVFIDDLAIHGGDFNYDLVQMGYAGVCGFSRFDLSASGTGRALSIWAQTQDSYWLNGYFQNGGTSDGAVACVEIDDSLGDQSGHNQNLVFLNTTWEAYNGKALRVFGKGAGPGNSLIDLISCKLESPTRSNVTDIEFTDAHDCRLDMRLLLGKGTNTAATKPEMILFNNCERMKVTANIGYLGGGAILNRVVTLGAGTIKSDIELNATDTGTIANLAADHIISAATLNNILSCNNFGLVSNEKRLVNNQQINVLKETTVEKRSINAVFERWVRTTTLNVTRSASRVIELVNSSGSKYWGANSNNNLAGGASADLDGAGVWEIDNTTGKGYFKSGLRTGATSATALDIIPVAGNPEGVEVARPGSLALNTTTGAVAGERVWFKATGTGNTGWISLF